MRTADPQPTLLAGFDFSFSKIFSDCCFVARPLIVAVRFVTGRISRGVIERF